MDSLVQKGATLFLFLALIGSAVDPALAQTDPADDDGGAPLGPPLVVSQEDTPLTFTFNSGEFDTDLYNHSFGYASNEFAGIDPDPAAAQLDATEFAVRGMSDGNLNFGDSGSAGDFARGNSQGGVSDGGLYGFDVDNSGDTGSIDNSEWALGVQPTSADMTSGTLFFCYQNQTGAQVNSVNLDFDVHEYNDEDGAVNVALAYNVNSSGCDASQSLSTANSSLTTEAAADAAPSWEAHQLRAYLEAPTIDDGDYLIVGLQLSASSGNAYDEVAVDNPTVTMNPSDAIPVELASFTAVSNESAALLRWQTASEENNAGFAVQHRSPSSTEWTRLGFVEGEGTTSQPQQYDYEVDDLGKGVHAFRLKQVDTDGTPHYSEPRSVEVLGEAGLQVQGPNPLRGGQQAEIEVSVPNAQAVTIGLYDVLGQRVRTVYKGQVGATEVVRDHLSTDGLSPGVYFLRARGATVSDSHRITVIR